MYFYFLKIIFIHLVFFRPYSCMQEKKNSQKLFPVLAVYIYSCLQFIMSCHSGQIWSCEL